MSALQWSRLTPATVEAAIKMLLLELHPGAQAIDGSGGDGGRDVSWNSPDGLVIFEIKSFAGGRLSNSQRRQITRSLTTATQHHPVRWVLVVPLDPSPAEEAWFDKVGADHPGICLEWLGLTWLNLHFGQREYLRRYVQGEAYDVLELAREYNHEAAVLTSAGDLVDRVRRLHVRAQDLAPGWSVDFLASDAGVRLSLTERSPGSGALDPVPLGEPLTFATENGTPPRDEDILDYGGEVVTAHAAHRSAVPGPAYQLVLATAAGAVRSRLALRADPPTSGRRGVRTVLQDATGIFRGVVRADRPEYGSTVQASLTTSDLAGRYPYEVCAALALFLSAEPTDHLQLRINDRTFGEPLGLDQTALAALLTEARHHAELITALDRLQSHTGNFFPLPDDITQADAADLLNADRLLDGQSIRLREDQITTTVRAERLEEFLQFQITLPRPAPMRIGNVGYSVTCGPHTITVEPVWLHAPRLELANVDELRAAVGTGAAPTARWVCVDGEGIYAQLDQPG